MVDNLPQSIPFTGMMLSSLVQFSEDLSMFNYDKCYAFLKGEKLGFIVLRITSDYPELNELVNDQFIKHLKVLIDISKFYYQIDTDGAIENYKKFELLSIKEEKRTSNSKFYLRGNSNMNSTPKVNTLVQNSSKSNFPFDAPEKVENKEEMRRSFLEKNKNEEKERNKESIINIINHHLQCIGLIVKIINVVSQSFVKLQNIIKDNKTNTMVYTEDLFDEIIIYLEENLEPLKKEALRFGNEYFYIKNSFNPLLSQYIDDVQILIQLLKGFRSIVSVDPIGTNESKIVVSQNLMAINDKYNQRKMSIYETKLYLFYIQFFLDNEYKKQLLLSTYFDKKKNNLLTQLNSNKNQKRISLDQQSNESTNSKNSKKKKEKKPKTIIDKILYQKIDLISQEKLIEKIFDAKVELYYFIFIFEKKMYLDSGRLDRKEILFQTQLLNKYMFIDSDEDIGIITILHVTNEYADTLLKDINNNLCKGNSEANSLHSNHESRTSSMVQNYNDFFKIKCEKNCYLLFYKISNYISIVIKYKENNINDINVIKEISANFRQRFTDYHILKSIIPFKKI